MSIYVHLHNKHMQDILMQDRQLGISGLQIDLTK